MFNHFKNRFISVMAPDLPPLPGSDQGRNRPMKDKFSYARPTFLQLLTADELRASADHSVRPIIVPRDINLLPWGTGYAECVNSGKSKWNEDQAAFCRQVLSGPDTEHPDLPYTYFGIFDGHAGYGAALAASHQFHHILHEKLVDSIELLLPRDTDSGNAEVNAAFPHPIHFQRRVSKDELIIGALESAFFHMDAVMAQDRARYNDAGGCTACVSLFIDGKMYVANAGDSRAVLCQRRATMQLQQQQQPQSQPQSQAQTETVIEPDPLELCTYPTPFSADHTPETERERLLNVARLKPHLMGKQYVAMEYAKRPHITDMGQRILCRQGTMKGWIYKTLTRDDLRMPVVNGEGKRSRLLGTLGVTRGFGDHDLLAINTGIQIKPFLTPHPDVKQRDLAQIVSIPDEHNEDGDYGILVMATDGLWDVSENEAVARTVFQTLSKYPTEKHRFTMVAQELVARARGKINDSGHWRLTDSKAAATVDDISVIVIPVYQYYKEHIEWTQNYQRAQQERRSRAANTKLPKHSGSIVQGIWQMTEEAQVVEEDAPVGQELDGSQVIMAHLDVAADVESQLNNNHDDPPLPEPVAMPTVADADNAMPPVEAHLETVKETLQHMDLDATTASETADAVKTPQKQSPQQQQQQQQQQQRKGKGKGNSKQ